MTATFIAIAFAVFIAICGILSPKDKTPENPTETDIPEKWRFEEQRRLDASLYRRSRLF